MKKFILLALTLLPSLTFAQQLIDINTVAQKVVGIGNLFVSLLIAFAVIWIIVGIIQYLIIGGGDPEKRKEGGMRILYGVIGLFLTMSIWGLVYILRNSFRFGNNNAPTQPLNNQIPNIPIVPNN